MRNTIIGGLLAVVVIGLLFLAANLWPHATPAQRLAQFEQQAAQSANQVQKGFVGVRPVGRWEVVCLATPTMVGGAPANVAKTQAPAADTSGSSDADSASAAASGDAQPAAHEHEGKTASNPPPAKPVSLGRCRASFAFTAPQRPGQPFASLSFRLVGDMKVLTAFVRFPPIGKRGEAAVLAWGPHSGFKLPVVGCSQADCVARVSLAVAAQTALLSAPEGVLILPPGPRGNRAQLRVPFIGLSPALTALRRAEG